MSARPRQHLRQSRRPSAEVLDVFDYRRQAEPKVGRPEHDLSDWRVTDDWSRPIPVTEAEIDVFEARFGDILDELFGPV